MREREREREREKPNMRERKRREEARKDAVQEPSHVGAQQTQRSVDDSHNTSSCLHFLSFSGVSWSLSLFLSLSLSLERMNGFAIFFDSRPVSFHITTQEEEEEQQEDAVLTVC
jgi:hypothetical protein